VPTNSSATFASDLEAVACTGRGSCESVGDYNDSSGDEQAMATAEVAGRWQRAVMITMPRGALANPGAFPVSVTCVKAGDCMTAGSYDVGAYPDYVPMAATQARGRWRRAVSIGLPAGATPDGSAMNSVACSSVRDCIAVGAYAVGPTAVRPMAAIQSRSRWARARQETLLPARHAAGGYFDGISCAPASGCVAAGGYQPTSKTFLPFTVVYTSGRWTHASALRLPLGAVSDGVQDAGLCAISCVRRGFCAVGGYYHYRAGVFLPMVATT
jgi:hypothetical protein